MSLTLKDLRVRTHYYEQARSTREATLIDLVEVLKAEGARELSQAEQWNHDLYPGRYLVLPLDGDT